MTNPEPLNKLLNASGFAFQLAVEDAVLRSQGHLGFEVVAREHPWFHAPSERTGFIDLVVEKNQVRFVIECKRKSDAQWLFLAPGDFVDPVQAFRCYWTINFSEKDSDADWGKVFLSPKSYLTQFCSVRGGGDGQVSMLDRLAADLVYSVEALAASEQQHKAASCYGAASVFLPVIVTNSRLYIAKFDPAKLDLRAGTIDCAEYEEVKYVRYQKALDPRGFTPNSKSSTIKEQNMQSQRSVFVVTSDALVDFLGEVDFHYDMWEKFPWVEAENRYRDRRA